MLFLLANRLIFCFLKSANVRFVYLLVKLAFFSGTRSTFISDILPMHMKRGEATSSVVFLLSVFLELSVLSFSLFSSKMVSL